MYRVAWVALVGFVWACSGQDTKGGASGASGVGGGPGNGSGGSSSVTTNTGGTVPSVECPALAEATGTIINVAPTQAGELHTIVDDAPANSTIVLAPGTYPLLRWLRFAKQGMTLRSSTNRASDVILDAGYSTDVLEAVVVTASDVTIAHVTIQRAEDHPIHVYPEDGTTNVTNLHVYGVTLIDGGEQFLKVNPNGARTAFVDGGTVECSTFRMTDTGRPHVERDPGGCYTGGIDVHASRGWVVRNNHFEGIYCAGEGLAEHAIHFWRGAQGTRVENNVIINCARGVGFGMGSGTDVSARPGTQQLGHIDGIIRNNVIWATIPYYDTGIELQQTSKPTVIHNTVVHAASATGAFSSIDYRFAGTDVVIRNNLTTRITVRDGATGTVDHNLENTPLTFFADVTNADFHLSDTAESALNQGVVVAESGIDMDGATNSNGEPDLGADER